MRFFEKRSSRVAKKHQADWTRTPAALFASLVLGVGALGGLGWSWNRTIERDARGVVSGPIPHSSTSASSTSASSDFHWPTGATRLPLPQGASLSAIKLIDLNTASLGELDLLPRVGPALAARIIADREENGAYETIEELERVRGIGPKTVDKLRSRVILSESTQASASLDEGG